MQKFFHKNSLYVHIPFCLNKCLFCSFAVSVGQGHRADDYIGALEREAQVHRGARLNTVYLGGGTPTFLSAVQLERLMKFLRGHFIFEPDCEITIEANPDDVHIEKAECLLDLGFNRVSMGAQTFDDRYLKFLGRTHDAARARAAFECLRQAGFGNINVDLMYGFPGQSEEELDNDARRLADLQREHVSGYTLTIEPNSRFYARQMKLDDEEKLARHYALVTQALETAGLRQYEVSNFARHGYESRHNSHYWTGGDYIGLGMGAHSHAAGRRFWNEDKLVPYLEKVNAAGSAVAGEENLSLRQRLGERFVLGLRTNKGVDHAVLEDEIGCRLEKDVLRQVTELVKEGFLEKEGTTVRATMKGRLVLDDISARLI